MVSSEWIHKLQNTRICSETIPHTLHAELLQAQKIRVWCTVSHRRIRGLIFHVNTVNAEEYIRIFTDFVNQLTDDELSHGYFQEDSAKCHTSRASMREIERFFEDQII